MEKRSAASTVKLLSVFGLISIIPRCDNWSCGPACQEAQKPQPIMHQPESAGPSASPEAYVPVSDRSEVLAVIEGKPLISRAQIDAQIDAEPQMKAMKQMLGSDCIGGQVLQALMNKAVVGRYAKDNNFNKRADYKEERERMIDSVEYLLNTKYFAQELAVNVGDAEVREFYDANKEKPNFLVSQGGVRAACIPFDKEQDAKAFVAKVEQNKGDIKKAAQAAGLADKLKDFMVINAQSIGIDPVLREKILALQKVPGTSICMVSDSSFYVVTATGKEEPKYVSYDDVRPRIKEMLENQKRMQVFQQKIEELAGNYKITRTKSGDELVKAAEECLQKARQAAGQGEMVKQSKR